MSARERECGELPSPDLSLSDRKVGQGLFVLLKLLQAIAAARSFEPDSEIRILEIRKKAEIRRPNLTGTSRQKNCNSDRCDPRAIRVAGFGFLSDLGFRTSDFGLDD